MVVPNKVAERIKKVREQKNYSQTYLAEKLGISQKAYSKIETGDTKLTVDYLFKISEILEVNINELLNAESLSIYNNYHTHNGKGIVVNKHTSEKVEELYEKLLRAKTGK
jgi:transcriptional regulator with XRE-family HTH domain